MSLSLAIGNTVPCSRLSDTDPHHHNLHCQYSDHHDHILFQHHQHHHQLPWPIKKAPDFSDPVVLRAGATVRDVCARIHKTLVDAFRSALVWGSSAKHSPQRVAITHHVHDEDVVMILTK